MVRTTRTPVCALIAVLWAVTFGTAQGPPALLPVPEVQGTPAPCCPSSPIDEHGNPLAYDRSLLYIPERHPAPRDFESRPRDERATWGRAALVLGETTGLNGLNPDWRAGIDAAFGVWWDADRSRGAEAGVLFLAEGDAQRRNAAFESRFTTAHADYRTTVGKVGKIKFDVLTGYRFASVGEDWTTTAGTRTTGNQFHGGTIGIAGEIRHGPWSADARASLGYGAVFRERDNLSSRGTTTLPEVAFGFGREILDGSRLFVGYRFVSLGNLVRPAGPFQQRYRYESQGVMLGLDWWF